MSGKVVIVAILALQVFITCSELPQPDQELVDKYNQLKDDFATWLYSYALKIGNTMDPIFGMYEKLLKSKAAEDYFKELSENPHVQRFEEVTRPMLHPDVVDAIWYLVEKARTDALALYGVHVRPWAGPYLDQAITAFKNFLNSEKPLELPCLWG